MSAPSCRPSTSASASSTGSTTPSHPTRQATPGASPSRSSASPSPPSSRSSPCSPRRRGGSRPTAGPTSAARSWRAYVVCRRMTRRCGGCTRASCTLWRMKRLSGPGPGGRCCGRMGLSRGGGCCLRAGFRASSSWAGSTPLYVSIRDTPCGSPFWGLNAADYGIDYASTLFERSIGFSKDVSALMSGLLQTWFFVASFIPWFLIDRVGRRPLVSLQFPAPAPRETAKLLFCFPMLTVLSNPTVYLHDQRHGCRHGGPGGAYLPG